MQSILADPTGRLVNPLLGNVKVNDPQLVQPTPL
jgi:hypothetical protein